MPTRTIMSNPDWATAYITSISSNIQENELPLPTLPQQVSESVSLNTYDQAIVARWAPIISYTSTNARTISFTIGIADDYMPYNQSQKRVFTIQEYINALKSLEYPRYVSNNKTNASEVVPPQCVLKLANIKASGIITSVNVNWNGPLSSAIYGGTYSRADVSIQFKEVSNTVKGSITVKNE